MGCSVESIQQALENYQPLDNRGGVHEYPGLSIIDDSYNANPTSMLATFASLQIKADQLREQGTLVKTYLILGDMGELGSGAKQYHQQVGSQANADFVLCCGQYAEDYVEGFTTNAQLSGQIYGFADKPALVKKLQQLIDENESIDQQLILVRGSRSARMEEVVSALVKNNKQAGS